jgi:endonuclease VIII
MPEGDTIHRTAQTLRAAMRGKRVTKFESPLAQLVSVNDATPLVGRTIEDVRAIGKHLLIDFSGGLHLRTHLRMNGSWHLYKTGEPWKRGSFTLRILIETEDVVALGFSIPVAEFLDDRALGASRSLNALGPDLLAPEVSIEDVIERAAMQPERELGDLLLDQHVAAGVGNVFKSEVLFVRRLNPFDHTSQLTTDELRKLYETAMKQLRLNVDSYGGGRKTTERVDPSARLYVYGRSGNPCRRCGTRIEYRKQGPDARGTYWCPTCQRAR